MDEPVDLPGTDVPSWVVALLLAIALLTLGGAGFVFLRN
jgi:hypothetical protein